MVSTVFTVNFARTEPMTRLPLSTVYLQSIYMFRGVNIRVCKYAYTRKQTNMGLA